METIQYRECPYSDSLGNLQNSWEYSRGILTQLNSALSRHFDCEEVTIPVAGSLGRLEAGTASDLDFFIVRTDGSSHDEYDYMVKLAGDLKIKLPSPDGVFTQSISFSSTLENLGKKDESNAELAQRLLLILETQPVFNLDFYNKIVDGVLDKYFYLHKESPGKEMVILINDLIKYFRHICVNCQFNFWHEEEKWALRNVKLRHSRVIMYAGLLFLILNSSKYGINKVDYVKERILLTPLERIASVISDNAVDPLPLLEYYDKFIGIINQETTRRSLIDVDYADRYNNSIYKILKPNSDNLQAYLTNFVLDMRGKWSNKAFEYLLF